MIRGSAVLAALCALCAAVRADVITSWTCVPLEAATIAPGATWSRVNCSSPSIPFFGPAGPVVVNVVTANLAAPGLRLMPLVAPPALGLAPLDTIANASGVSVVAGINGGYFFRLDEPTFIDGVCLCKNAADAKQAADPSSPNSGIGDGATVSNGKWLASSCDCPCCFNKPTVVTINGTSTHIDLLAQGEALPGGTDYDSLTAGPFLLSTNASGTHVSIPDWDLNVFNVLEHSANTALGLAPNGTSYFVTFDGRDGCSIFDPTCGTNAYTMAYFLKDHLGASSGMGMDQGGSTTMYVRGKGTGGIVTNPGAGVRNIYNGLFLVQG